ncbi:hypothetical protein [Chitinophaga nivalis]|uniref:Uncharacterized protein n=1 Tax=Chitinophaga nivalis TaxID=2991709 RepID=A0ABT3IJ78_9BACT|nr:hypothetical protein [Chitinophaga nivalis]MCW3466299.1 hypothetical protein [Chitinophaga nivalis]MCW3484010.1 hypothetical protein [Chitinophaga nivalis]
MEPTNSTLPEVTGSMMQKDKKHISNIVWIVNRVALVILLCCLILLLVRFI